MESFPEQMVADKKMILKNVKDYYRARGTEKSLKFLMRAVYGDDNVEVYYPKLDILEYSGGNWFVQRALRLEDVKIDGVANSTFSAVQLFTSSRLVGQTSNTTAVVEGIDRFFESGQQVDELSLSSVSGSFEDGETISSNVNTGGGIVELTANVFGGGIITATVTNAGSGYSVGNPVIITDSGDGTGADIKVSSVTSGNVATIIMVNGGAGFQANDFLLITGGGGSGANAEVLTVADDGSVHQNSYNIYISSIADEANTLLANTYANLNNAVANTIMANAFTAFMYANTGPASIIRVNSPGDNYTTNPTVDIRANTRVKSLGIIGRVDVIDGGSGYSNGDILEFQNVLGGYGVGANAVVEVDGTGIITNIQFTPGGPFPNGGIGYTQSKLPTINIATSTGAGANLQTKAILGDGESMTISTGSIGVISGLTVFSQGSGYSAPVGNLAAYGDGTATVDLTAISGDFSFPGRYLDDESHLSSFSFLQDKDYYQRFSYVIRMKKSLKDYRDLVNEVITPSGVILFGDYMLEESFTPNVANVALACCDNQLISTGTYTANGQNVQLTLSFDHNLVVGNTVYIEFVSGDTANLTNGVFNVDSVGSVNTYNIVHVTGTTETSGDLYSTFIKI